MFQQRRQASLGNISLGTLSAPPSYEDMSFLLEQAMKYRGRFVEVNWHVPKTGATFQLTAKIVPQQPLPSWMLYKGGAGNSNLVWGHNSNDLTLMHNLVMLECEKPSDGGSNSISANAMEGMVSSNRSAGAIAGATGQEPALPASMMPQASPSPAPAAGNSPQATWLSNLNNIGAGATGAGTSAPSAGSPAAVAAPAIPDATAAGAPAEAAIEAPIDLSLDGSLSNISVANLLKYICNNRLSGRLALQSSVGAGELFFQSGAIKHAATLESKGENAIYDFATWTDGQFHFHADEQTAQHTVDEEANAVVQRCQQMVQYYRALVDGGLHPASYVVRTNKLNRTEFERALQYGIQLDVHLQHRLYESVTGDRTLTEILRACPLVRAEWIPAMYNLLRVGVLGISDGPANARPGMFLEGEPINKQAIDGFLSAVTLQDCLIAHGAFLYLLQQEFYRHERTGSRFALALFSIAKTNLLDGNVAPLDQQALMEAGKRIALAKRKLDIIGHFDEQNCALLLPETDSAGAAVFANRLTHLLKKPALSSEMDGQVLVCSFGIASIPDDARDLETLIAAVRVAKNKSRMMGAPVILYGDHAR